MSTERRSRHQRNEKLERLLSELSAVLAPAEAEIAADFDMPKYPPIFVVGPPRSGTTILMQWLAATNRFAYPTNLLSRFYAAPWIGAKIQQLLTDPDYDFRDELFDMKGDVTFRSTLGKTIGALAPNEFWYFWRRFIPNEEPRHLSPEEERAIDGKGLASELAALESVFDKPVAMKAMIVQYNIPTVSACFDRALFLHVRRAPLYNVQSILEARVEYYGTRDAWYSAKPAEYAMLSREDCFRQAAGQVHFTHRAIEQGLSAIDPSRSLDVSYEDLCLAPAETYRALVDKLARQGCAVAPAYEGPAGFESTNVLRCDGVDRDAIAAAWSEISATPAAW
jgi:hypothetical protein